MESGVHKLSYHCPGIIWTDNHSKDSLEIPIQLPPLPLSNDMILYNVFDIVMERVSGFFYLLNYVESYCCSNQYIQEMGSQKASFIVRVQFPAVRMINSGDIFLYFSFFN